MPARHLVTVTVMALAVTACAMTPPKRDAYAGADNVGAVTPAMLVGTWQVRILNPVEGEQGTDAQITYNADGTVNAISQSNASGQQARIEMAGTWQTEGETVAQTLESMKDTSGSAMNKMFTQFAAGMVGKKTTRFNVMEASPNRVIIVSEHGQAQEFTRLR